MIHRFTGHIAAAGHGDNVLVLGAWHTSPFGAFADVMIRHADGVRELIAPTDEVAAFVSTTYSFDLVQVAPLRLARSSTTAHSQWRLRAGDLSWSFQVGQRSPLGLLLTAQPPVLRQTEAYSRLINPIARRWMNVSTWGSAGQGRTEWYAATDLHEIASSQATYAGADLGAIGEVADPGFGFSPPPPTPSLTALTSCVRD
ncbi:MAG: hypothetical protein Q4P33_09330 [Flaviflexus sp.]|nr:hypothetical protein [Flaviflexus sp.]